MSNEEKLIKRYRDIFLDVKSRPQWAVRRPKDDRIILPTIPFIGKKYSEKNNCKILVYASAENLTYTINNDNCRIFDDEFAINRHRICFDETKKKRFFPSVHLAPMSGGCLLLFIAYIYNLLSSENLADDIDPKDFYEKIAFANFGKFSIATTSRNEDYANNKDKLIASIEYVKADLEVLRPEYIFLPESIYKLVKKHIQPYIENVKVVLIRQINSTTINCYFAKNYSKKQLSKFPNFLKRWYEYKDENNLEDKLNISGKTKENYRSVFTFADEIVQIIK